MIIDLGSFAYGSTLENGAGTPSWGTSLGQSRPEYYITREGSENIVMGMVYCAVPLDSVSLPLGKGGRVCSCLEAGTIQVASVFKKVFVNNVLISHPFIMVLQKEDSESHSGRRGIKYTDKASFIEDNEHIYSNSDFVRLVYHKFGLEDNACWFVYDIDVKNYEELHFKAVFVNNNQSETYANSQKRSEEWSKLIERVGDKYKIRFIENSPLKLEDLPLQRIFYGAPGTGKSNTIKREVEAKGRVHFRTTFHPDSDYSTFVGCYKPTMVEAPVRDGSGHEVANAKPEEKNRISYSFVPQAFAKAYCEAWNKYDSSENAEPVFLIIEEINRGNCAQIFGDIFQLLDREMDGDRCGFSTYPIDADEDLKAFLETGAKKDGTQWLTNKDGIKDGKLCLPPNLYIWATMNTSDQSLFPIDSAFKRRWDWKYVPIDTKKENWTIKTASNEYSWSSFLEKINEEIDSTTHSEDKMLGFYFCRANNGVIDADKFVSKVLFYIYNDVFKDYGFDREMFKDEEGKVMSFKSYYKTDGTINESKVERFLDNLTKDKE